MPTAAYSHGHHTSVVSEHARRTAADSAAYLIPHISPASKILDVGCGPGTITADLAALAPQGHVTGVDFADSVLAQASSFAESRGLKNVSFQKADALQLPFSDGEFDIVHAHQVLQHVSDPVAMLKEMRRVTRPGGLVAAREADYKTFAWYPEPEGLKLWIEFYEKVARANGGEPAAGRYVHVWARDAGFEREKVRAGWGSWRYEGERAKLWSLAWKERVRQPAFLAAVEREKLATPEDIESISKTWEEWGTDPMAMIIISHGEILCWKE